MQTKIVNRNIPPERENHNDRYRVKYDDRHNFEILQVHITRIADGSTHDYYFKSTALPDKDSIHFSTAIENNKFTITWFGANPFKNN